MSQTNAINAISVDVEDYFQTEAMSAVASRSKWDSFPAHVEANTCALFELFARFDVKATFFFMGWVAERFPQLARKAHELGHEVGCHSYWHHPVFRMTSKAFREDTYRARSVIEDATGVPVWGYRAPNFSINRSVSWAYQILDELGFQYDSSVYPIRHELYGNHRARRHPYMVSANLMEIPLATWRVFNQNLPVGGGAYLRILPYVLMKHGIRAINEQERASAVLYLHPWEIDDAQPRLQASWKSRMRQYTGLAGMSLRLERLLREFSLGRIYDSVYLPSLERMRDGTPHGSQPKSGCDIPGSHLKPHPIAAASTPADTDVH
jgi:polysaccharide deacetylase family protein (PEP-CTERM system associated)